MGHLLSLLFAVLLSCLHMQPVERASTDFVPPDSSMTSSAETLPLPARGQVAHRDVLNSYSEDACASCRSNEATSHGRLLLRAPR